MFEDSINDKIIKSKTYEETDRLIKAGADVTYENSNGETALMLAKTAEQTKLLLVNAGDNTGEDGRAAALLAYVNVKSRYGDTALMYARSIEQTKIILDHGADVNAKNDAGYTALIFAKTAEQTKLLIKAGADVNAKTVGGITALMYANSSSQIEILDEAGADINIKNLDGNKAIHCCEDDNLEKMKALIRMGADVEAVGQEGQHPIHISCIDNSYDILRFLLKDAGIDHTVKDSNGRDVFHYAERDVRIQEILTSFFEGS